MREYNCNVNILLLSTRKGFRLCPWQIPAFKQYIKNGVTIHLHTIARSLCLSWKRIINLPYVNSQKEIIASNKQARLWSPIKEVLLYGKVRHYWFVLGQIIFKVWRTEFLYEARLIKITPNLFQPSCKNEACLDLAFKEPIVYVWQDTLTWK